MKRVLDLSGASLSSIEHTLKGDTVLKLSGGDASDRCLIFSIVWFYNQLKSDSHNEVQGLFELHDSKMPELIYEKSCTMLKPDLAKHYRVVLEDFIFDLVTITSPKLEQDGKTVVLDERSSTLLSTSKALNTRNCFGADFLSDSYNVDDFITGNIEFDDDERFVIDEKLNSCFEHPIEIQTFKMQKDIFELTLTSGRDEKKYEIRSKKIPELVQFVDELVTDDVFRKVHKIYKDLGAIYKVEDSTVLNRLNCNSLEKKMIRIEDSDIPMNIVTSHSLFYKKLTNEDESEWKQLF